jgi:hypothetical protein
MKTSFGGIGVAIMTHREEFEIEYEKVTDLMAQLADRSAAIAKMQSDLLQSVEKSMHGDKHLHKLAGSVEFGKRLTATKDLVDRVIVEIDQMKKLQDQCRAALDRAKAVLPDYAKWMGGRLGVPPAQKQSRDVNKAAFEAQFQRRFQ